MLPQDENAETFDSFDLHLYSVAEVLRTVRYVKVLDFVCRAPTSNRKKIEAFGSAGK
ncbi:predicted protein [Histoplasma capsulatum var. duboisii H88]|uniref:Predicted protein n=2 Tax=Ajellomyces capsulatus TaxID=5037 RepID=F0UU94_AJEC8|nr:predicted protein [Histoplasma capsulatum H143]EGC49471.1 predicted protein [Histoplasma capsulatum var. duboisii H88]